ncbi:Calcineurin-like_phosphoesterase [Hexamita inflata]|uniref:Calcineurin-like phosphoesterase n=1 Tax=Hexamita inflata TaxID=28002 RepID=A0AA86PE16_9EUKA|nr:Calcineurin-like phosphoesterase [Hexamita inflata]
MSQTNNQLQNNIQNQWNGAINITFISDTHERHQYLNSELYYGDIIVHTGDLTNGEINPYDMTPVINFLSWFSSLPYKYKIFIGGNHDLPLMHQVLQEILLQFPNVIYLNKKAVVLTVNNQSLKFYGIPFVSHLNGWAFNIPSEQISYMAQQIEECDVLLTHDAPYNNQYLFQRVNAIQPKIHAFGHMHEFAGITYKQGILYIDGAQMGFPVYDHIYKPIRVQISNGQMQIVNYNEITHWKDFPYQ